MTRTGAGISRARANVNSYSPLRACLGLFLVLAFAIALVGFRAPAAADSTATMDFVSDMYAPGE